MFIKEVKETPELSLHLVRKQSRGSCLQARKRVFTRNQISTYLDLELLSLQNYEVVPPEISACW